MLYFEVVTFDLKTSSKNWTNKLLYFITKSLGIKMILLIHFGEDKLDLYDGVQFWLVLMYS